MRYLHGLVLAAVFCIVKTEPSPEELKTEIAETQKETKRVREEILQLKIKSDEQRKQLDTIAKRIKNKTEGLTKEQNELIDTMYNLNITASTIEFYLEQDKYKLEKRANFSYRLAFIKKLLRQDLQLLVFRRNKGDEEHCFEFEANNTAIDQGPLDSDDEGGLSTRVFSPHDRLLSILEQRLNAAQMDLAKAINDLQLERNLVSAQEAFMNKLIKDSKEIEEKLIEAVNDAKKIIKELEDDIAEKKAEEKELHDLFVDELIYDILELKKQIASFHKAQECYTKLENEIF